MRSEESFICVMGSSSILTSVNPFVKRKKALRGLSYSFSSTILPSFTLMCFTHTLSGSFSGSAKQFEYF